MSDEEIEGSRTERRRKRGMGGKKREEVVIDTVSGQIEAREKKEKKKRRKKKQSSSQQSLRNDDHEGDRDQLPLPPPEKTKSRRKRIKLKTKEDKMGTEDPESTRSVVNLLSSTIDGGDADDDDPQESPMRNVVKRKSKKRDKGSASSLQRSHDSLRGHSGSQSSLQDYFPDPALKNVLQGLHDDVQSLDGEANDYASRFTPSPALPAMPPFPPSEHSDKIFLEKEGGFSKTSQRKLTSKLPNNQVQPDLHKPAMTPLDLGLESQKVFRSIGVFCHGFLAGLAFWQVIMVFVLSEGGMDLMEFIALYSPLSQPLHLVFYFLTVICTISILDRYDVAQFDWRQLQKLLTFRSGGVAILVYVFTLILTLATTKMDDKLSLYQHNSTIFEQIDQTELETELNTWKALNLCRSVGVILGWILVSMRPNTDLLYKHLRRLSDYRPKKEMTP